MISIDPTYQAAFTNWRRAREEWKTLTQAIREERPREEIDRLAGPAGVDLRELLDLLTQHAVAKAHARELSKAPEMRARARVAKARLEAAELMLNKKGLSVREQEAAIAERDAAAIVERATSGQICVLEMSERFVDAARAAGVL